MRRRQPRGAQGAKKSEVRPELPKPRQRMLPEERERLILREATRYFAEHGLSGGTLELARRLGITQPLLYKYFPTKDAMIERVFEGLFPGHWDPRWEMLLNDESIPVRERLKRFYKDFAKVVLTYEHVRLFLYSGLGGFAFNARYYDILAQRIFTPIARALRKAFNADGARAAQKRVTEQELELVQSLHAAVYHVGFRRWIHGSALPCDIDEMIDLKVDLFLDGAAATIARAAPGASRKTSTRTTRKRQPSRGGGAT